MNIPLLKNRGFTLVEMIVSLAIFSVVAVIAIGALLKVIDANKKAQSIQSSVTNVTFALESMSRDIRTGTNITCSQNVPSSMPQNLSGQHVTSCVMGVPFIAFYSTRTAVDPDTGPCNLITAYAFVYDTPGNIFSPLHLQKAEQMACNDGTYTLSDVVSPSDMTITSFKLGALYGSSPTYPLVFVDVIGYAGILEQNKTYVDLETAISSRAQQ